MRLLISALLTISAGSAATAAPGIAGNWLVQDRTAVVTIAPCGNSLCGEIAKILVQKPDTPKTDIRNPDPALRNRPFIGLRILGGFTPTARGWENGRIYDPKTGKSYKSELRLNADGSLGVSGCIAFICKTQRWTRAR